MDINYILDWLSKNHETANSIATIASAIIAAAAIILSIISIAVALFTLKNQKQHNKLSVRPLAYVMIGDYDGHIFVKIRNHGTGPLILKSVKIIGAKNPNLPLINSMPPLEPGIAWKNFVEDCTDRSVPVGGEIDLVDLTFHDNFPKAEFEKSSLKVRKALGRLEIQVNYTDIYGSALTPAQRNLKFFHRLISETDS